MAENFAQTSARIFARTIDTPIGLLSILSTATEIYQVSFGDVTPTAPTRSCEVLDEACTQLNHYFAGRLRAFAFPLRTPPQSFAGAAQRALSHVPYGSTWTYAQLADAAGSPRAIRAAGTACAKNPLPIFVPCHRIIRSDGDLGNYAGGAAAKRWLLEFEAKIVGNQLGIA